MGRGMEGVVVRNVAKKRMKITVGWQIVNLSPSPLIFRVPFFNYEYPVSAILQYNAASLKLIYSHLQYTWKSLTRPRVKIQRPFRRVVTYQGVSSVAVRECVHPATSTHIDDTRHCEWIVRTFMDRFRGKTNCYEQYHRRATRSRLNYRRSIGRRVKLSYHRHNRRVSNSTLSKVSSFLGIQLWPGEKGLRNSNWNYPPMIGMRVGGMGGGVGDNHHSNAPMGIIRQLCIIIYYIPTMIRFATYELY